MPRVLVVTTVHDPRDARIAVRQIGALVAAGCTVTYAAPFAARGVPPPAGVAAIDLPRAHGRRRLRALAAARRVVREHAPMHDVVLVHDPELLLAMPGVTSDATVVWDVHEDAPAAVLERAYLPSPVRRLASWVLRSVERAAASRVELILAEAGYQTRFDEPHPVVRNLPVVPSSVDEPRHDRVVYVGRVSVHRGANQLIELGRRLEEVSVDVVGWADDDVAPSLARAATDGHVRWQGQDGFVDNQTALGTIDGALAGLSLLGDLPNYRVAMPTKVLEYMAHGVPVITTPLPEAVAVVERAGCGVVVPFGDVDAVVDAVDELAHDQDRAREMGRRGWEAARREHDWTTESRHFVDLVRAWTS